MVDILCARRLAKKSMHSHHDISDSGSEQGCEEDDDSSEEEVGEAEIL